MATLHNISVGRAKLVEREALSDFPQRLQDAEHPAELFARMRSDGGKGLRRKL